MELDLGEVDIAATVDAAIEGAAGPARRSAAIRIETRHRRRTPAASSPTSKRVRQMLFNLLVQRHRLLARRRPGRRSRPRRDGDMIEFAVTDQGPGIPRDFIGNVFDRFASHAARRGARRRRPRPVDRARASSSCTAARSRSSRRKATARPSRCACRCGRRSPPSRRNSCGVTRRRWQPFLTLAAPRRGGDGGARRGRRGDPRARRRRRALRRPRRRQDDLRPRAHPRACRRSGARGAEPDLHAGADLCRRPPDRSPISTSTASARPDELDEIGLDEALADGAVLVEWPERGRRPPARRPPRHRASTSPASGRRGDARRRAPSMASPHRAHAAPSARFLDRAGLAGRRAPLSCRATPRPAATSASRTGGQQRRADGLADAASAPGAATRRAAFRARDVRAFIAVDDALRAIGLSAPEIYRRRPRSPACCCSRTSAARASFATARPIAGALSPPPSMCWP